MKPGTYHFSVTVGFPDCGFIRIHVMYNGRDVFYAK